MRLFGRDKIYTSAEVITRENVVDVLRETISAQRKRSFEIDYLYRYWKGEQPILKRVKEVRPEITNRIVENIANEIVSFKTGYLMGEPIQYIPRDNLNETTIRAIGKLNDYMAAEDKETKDKELADWFHIAGTSVRMILPDSEASENGDDAPFEIYTLDPRFSYVAYNYGLGEKPVMGVKYINVGNQGKRAVYSVYTEDRYFEIEDLDAIRLEKEQYFGIPMVEYPLNTARLGAFEVVLPLLDAVNTVESNRLDAIEQFVQALMLFHNVDIDSDDFRKLRQDGAIRYKDIEPSFPAEIKYLIQELNQSQTQTVVDHYYDKILTICGLPNRNGGSSTSDTGSAVVLRDGWSAAETRAKSTEMMFKKSEREFLKLAIRTCQDLRGLDLKLSDIDIRFTRRNYENITEKANVLTMMLNNDKIAPQLAFSHSGMFSDPLTAYRISEDYAKQQEESNLREMEQFAQQETERDKERVGNEALE